MRREIVLATTLMLCGLTISGCGDLTKPGPVGQKGYDPVRIKAAWTGGATIVANRTATEPALHNDAICPASSMTVDVQTDRVGFSCSCPMSHPVYACAVNGRSSPPDTGLPECAADPLQTPLSRLREVYVGKSSTEIIVPMSGLDAINVFYCGSASTLSGPPLTCVANVTMINTNRPSPTSR